MSPLLLVKDISEDNMSIQWTNVVIYVSLCGTGQMWPKLLAGQQKMLTNGHMTSDLCIYALQALTVALYLGKLLTSNSL